MPACDARTDGRTDGFTIASTALRIASYADALYKCFTKTFAALFHQFQAFYVSFFMLDVIVFVQQHKFVQYIALIESIFLHIVSQLAPQFVSV